MEPAVIVLFATLVIFLVLGFHIGIAMSVSVLAALWVGDLSYLLFTQRLYNSFDSFPLLAVPFFIMAGEIMQRGSMSESLINFSRTLVGHTTGALSQISILTSMFYGALCGSAPATTAAVGGMMIPAMEKDGYPKDFASAVNACSGCLGLLIPPSVTLIIYGSIAGVSISNLFIAVIIPGILCGAALGILPPRQHGMNGGRHSALQNGLSWYLSLYWAAYTAGLQRQLKQEPWLSCIPCWLNVLLPKP